jgi:hypothetical protein
MSQLTPSASVNDEIVKGSTRFRFDGTKWNRVGQNFDYASLAEQVAAYGVGSVNGLTGDVVIEAVSASRGWFL